MKVILITTYSVTITSILRVTAVSNSLRNRSDLTWNFIPRGIWTLIEANAGIIGACLPIFRQPLALLFPRIFRSGATSRSRGHGSQHAGAYQLSDDFATRRQPPNWQGGKTPRVLSGPRTSTKLSRTSDEQHIISESSKSSDSAVEGTNHGG